MPGRFNLENYVTVNERIQKFWQDHPNGRLITFLEHLDGADAQNRMCAIKAEAYKDSDDSRPSSTGFAKEREGLTGANTTSFVENCETSAIGRALANMGLLIEKNKASADEMRNAERVLDAHQDAINQIKALGQLLEDDSDLKIKIRDSWTQIKTDPLVAIRILAELETNMT